MTKSLARFPIHLGKGSHAVPQPEFTGMEWYQAYQERTARDGGEGWLVSFYTFGESWKAWEMHPNGDEIVVCTVGEITLVQEFPDGVKKTVLRPGEYAVNTRGTWHTADVSAPCTALFITAGRGTEHRQR